MAKVIGIDLGTTYEILCVLGLLKSDLAAVFHPEGARH